MRGVSLGSRASSHADACRRPRRSAARAAFSPRGVDESAALAAAGSFVQQPSGVYARGSPALVPKVDMYGDPMNLLLSQRIVFLGSDVNDFTADAVVSQLLLLDAQDSTKDIRLYINSPGGSVTAGACAERRCHSATRGHARAACTAAELHLRGCTREALSTLARPARHARPSAAARGTHGACTPMVAYERRARAREARRRRWQLARMRTEVHLNLSLAHVAPLRRHAWRPCSKPALAA